MKENNKENKNNKKFGKERYIDNGLTHLRENKDININCILNNHISILLFIFFFLMFFPIYLSKRIEIRKLDLNSEITITIKGGGSQSILSNGSVERYGPSKFEEIPTEILVNNISLNYTGKIIYDLTNQENIITMIWNYQNTDCTAMFYDLSNITKIDLSKFDTSKVTDMKGMFYGCTSLTSINFSNFNTSSVTNMGYMFYKCVSLEYLDLSNFDTSSVTIIEFMFNECNQLISLNIDNFNTKNVNKMSNLFNGCTSLISLNLKSFDTSSVTEMSCMFYNCYSLTSLNLKNFNTSQNLWMDSMFLGCKQLTSLNLRNFNTSLIKWMNGVFSYCNSLKYLDISNFNTSIVERMDAMFQDCSSLKFLNLKNFNTSSVTRMDNLFNGCISLISLNLSSFDTSKVSQFDHMFEGCISLISLDLKNFDTSSTSNELSIFNGCNNTLKFCINEGKASKIMIGLSSFNNLNCTDNCFLYSPSQLIVEKTKCIESCSNDNMYRFEYNNICYESCPEGTHNSSIKEFLCEEDLICDNYYNYNYTDCLDSIPEGYFLNNTILKTIDKCHIKCKNCTLQSMENNLCISCNNNQNYYSLFNDSSNNGSFINCYNQEFDGFYLDNNENIYKPCYSTCKKCTELGDINNNKCSECYSNYTLNNSNCYIINNTYKDEYFSDNTNDYITYEYYNNDETSSVDNIEQIINDFITSNNNRNISSYYYEINLDKNEIKTKSNNITYIDFPIETKNFLIKQFNLDEEKDKLYILIFDNLASDLNIAISNYSYKVILENGTELNLSSINENYYYDVYSPLIDLIISNYNYSIYFIKQGYDIYDKKSDFYNDICSSAFIDKNDITLDDRKKYIYPNNATLCKDNCKYKSINIEEKRIICECNLNINSNSTNEDEIFLDSDDDNFLSYLLDNINYKIFKCFKIFLIFDNLKNSYAFYTMIFIFFIVIINCFSFFFYSIRNIRRLMMKYYPTKQKVNNELINELKKREKNKDILLTNIKKDRLDCNIYNGKRKKHRTKTVKIQNNKRMDLTNSTNHKILQGNLEINQLKTVPNKKEVFDNLPFTQAIHKDKRSFFKIFMSVLIQKLDLINLIIGQHNLRIILIYQYILSLLIDFFFNAFFYSDDIVSKKYHNNGKLNFIVTVTLSIASNIITSIICNFLNFSKGAEERLEEIMNIKNEFGYLYALDMFIKVLKIRVFNYIIIEIILISFSFYYILIFSIIYQNSQISLLINYFTSLLESLITSIIISLIIVITRKIGIIYLNNNIYNTSKYINNNF